MGILDQINYAPVQKYDELRIGIDIGYKNFSVSIDEHKINLHLIFSSKHHFFENIHEIFLYIRDKFGNKDSKFLFYVESQHIKKNIILEYYILGIINVLYDNKKTHQISSKIKKTIAKKINFEYKKITSKKSFKEFITSNSTAHDFFTNGWYFVKIDYINKSVTESRSINILMPKYDDYIDSRLLLESKKKVE